MWYSFAVSTFDWTPFHLQIMLQLLCDEEALIASEISNSMTCRHAWVASSLCQGSGSTGCIWYSAAQGTLPLLMPFLQAQRDNERQTLTWCTGWIQSSYDSCWCAVTNCYNRQYFGKHLMQILQTGHVVSRTWGTPCRCKHTYWTKAGTFV